MTSRVTPPARSPLTLGELVARLAPVLGREKSQEEVASAVATLGTFNADAVIQLLQERPGLIGVAARRILAQPAAPRSSMTPNSAGCAGPPLGAGRGATPPIAELGEARTVSTQSVVDLLSPSLGEEASSELVGTAKMRSGVAGDPLTMGAALRVLEVLAAEPGLVGVSARFAKARLMLPLKGSADGRGRKPLA